MNVQLEKRFGELEVLLVKLEEVSIRNRQVNETKKEVAKALDGKPYYYGEYKGTLQPHDSDPTKVITYVRHQVTGSESLWIFDSLVALEHYRTIQSFANWESYHQAKMEEHVSDMEKLMIRYNYKEKERHEILGNLCLKHNVSYKNYRRAM